MPPDRIGTAPRDGPSRLGAAALPAERLRLTAYTIGLCVAFGLYLLVDGPGQGVAFWVCALGVSAGLASGFAWREAALGRVFGAAAAGAVLLALAVPLAPGFLGGEPLARIVAAHPLWPQVLVCLFASRVLAEACDLRFAAFWQAPLRPHSPVRIQSNVAALALGACFTLLFYQAAWFIMPERTGGTTLTAIVASALAGETLIHRAIIFLFFVILAYLCDAGLHYRTDREALAALQAELARAKDTGWPRWRALTAGPLAPFAHTRTIRLLAKAAAPGGAREERLAAEAFDAFHAASRRFVRGLLPFLPLLGFFGTVVGLATAMAALPTGGEGRIDLSGSLSGLALKFETTLLGILASMVASILLATLEKGEAELAAECALLAGAVEPADEP